jgi:hypothetical protein
MRPRADHVLCGKMMSGFKGALAQVLIGNSYSTTPELKARFQAVAVPTGTRVQVVQWVETQMAFGQIRRQELNGSKAFNDAMALLGNLGGTSTPIPVGSAAEDAQSAVQHEPPAVASAPPQARPMDRTIRMLQADTPSGYCLYVPPGVPYLNTVGPATQARPLCPARHGSTDAEIRRGTRLGRSAIPMRQNHVVPREGFAFDQIAGGNRR